MGSVGMEPYGPSALLRSLVVAPDLRNQGIGQALAKELIARLRQQGTRQVFLLTETTLTFFERLGFRRIPRSEADPAVQQSVEFRSAFASPPPACNSTSDQSCPGRAGGLADRDPHPMGSDLTQPRQFRIVIPTGRYANEETTA